jgi:hypothetical protein
VGEVAWEVFDGSVEICGKRKVREGVGNGFLR